MDERIKKQLLLEKAQKTQRLAEVKHQLDSLPRQIETEKARHEHALADLNHDAQRLPERIDELTRALQELDKRLASADQR